MWADSHLSPSLRNDRVQERQQVKTTSMSLSYDFTTQTFSIYFDLLLINDVNSRWRCICHTHKCVCVSVLFCRCISAHLMMAVGSVNSASHSMLVQTYVKHTAHRRVNTLSVSVNTCLLCVCVCVCVCVCLCSVDRSELTAPGDGVVMRSQREWERVRGDVEALHAEGQPCAGSSAWPARWHGTRQHTRLRMHLHQSNILKYKPKSNIAIAINENKKVTRMNCVSPSEAE